MRGRPEEGAGFDDGVAVAAMGLEPVMSPAERGEVAVARGSAARRAPGGRRRSGGTGGSTRGRRRWGGPARRAGASGRRSRTGPPARGRQGRAPAPPSPRGRSDRTTHARPRRAVAGRGLVAAEQAVARHRVEGEVEVELGVAWVRARRPGAAPAPGGIGQHAQGARAAYVEGVGRQVLRLVLLRQGAAASVSSKAARSSQSARAVRSATPVWSTRTRRSSRGATRGPRAAPARPPPWSRIHASSRIRSSFTEPMLAATGATCSSTWAQMSSGQPATASAMRRAR